MDEDQWVQEMLRIWELRYISESKQKEKRQDWIHDAIGYWNGLDNTEKKSILFVNTSDLDYFSCEYLNIPWLRDLLADVVTFYELFKRWDVYICPSPECLRWFFTSDLLISHLACEHLPEIHQTNAWPLRRNWTEETWCAESLRNTVWKPIDVERAFGFLYDACRGSHDGGSLFNNLPLSKDSRRSELLEKLGKGFQKLIEHQEKSSFSMLSNGRLRALIRLAAKHILDPTRSISLAYPFRNLLEQVPICFCFLEEESLSCLVQLVDDMVHFVNQVTTAPPNGIMDLSRDYECDGECLDALSAPQRNGSHYYFELNEDEINWQLSDPDRLPRWLFEAPCTPSIELLPAKASEIFHQLESKVKSFVNRLTITYMQPAPAEVVYFELWSAMCSLRNRTYESLVGSPPSLLSTEESNLWNGKPLPVSYKHCCFSCLSAEKHVQLHGTAFCSKIEPGYLELIKLSFELQCLKPQIQELCTIDLRKCILPLIRSFLRMKLFTFVNVYYRPVEDRDVQKSTEKGCIKRTEEEGEGLTANDSSDETAEDCRHLSVSDTEYEDKSTSVASWVKTPANRSLYLFLRESGLLETKVTGLLVWGSITDVIKHCVQRDCWCDAHDIWERKTYKSLKYWWCCFCDSAFPYQELHMDHMECKHQLGFPHNAYWLMLMPYKQDEIMGEVGSEPEKEALSGSTVAFDGSVTFDHNYNYFLVDAAELCHIHSRINGEEFRVQVQHIKDQLSILRHLFDVKYEFMSDFLHPMSDSAFSRKLMVDTEILQCCARIEFLKKCLSECCLSEYNILSPIGSFIQAVFGIESVNLTASSARQRFEALLCSVTCSDLPSLNLELQSPGKVLVKINEHGGRFGFAYVGMSWKFIGEMSIGKRTKRTVNGSLQMVASSNWESDCFLTDENMTLNVFGVNAIEKESSKLKVQGTIRQDVIDKLREFEAEFARSYKEYRGPVNFV